MFRFIISFFLLSTLFACGDAPVTTNEQVQTIPEEPATQTPDPDTFSTDEVVAVTKSAPVAPELGVDFPEDQLVTLGPDQLATLCDHKYGCIEEEMYPLGWSPDGKFAYLLQAANEAVQNTTIHFTIQDMESDEILEKHTFEARKQAGWSEETDNYSVLGIWRKYEVLYDSLLRQHQIRLGAGTAFYPLSTIEEQQSVRFEAQDKMRHNALFDLQEVDQHQVVANTAERQSKTICRQMMGKYDLIVASQPLGAFSSPFEDRLAILDGLEKRGYEGPPNVLRLQLVGCDLRKGFK